MLLLMRSGKKILQHFSVLNCRHRGSLSYDEHVVLFLQHLHSALQNFYFLFWRCNDIYVCITFTSLELRFSTGSLAELEVRDGNIEVHYYFHCYNIFKQYLSLYGCQQ